MRQRLLVLSVPLLVACAGGPAAPVLGSDDVARSPEPRGDGGGQDFGEARVEFSVREASGVPKEEVARRLLSSNGPLRRCLGKSGGKIEVRIGREPGGALRVQVEPGSSLSLTRRECVLDALSTIDLEDTGANAALPRPPGFTSLISISW